MKKRIRLVETTEDKQKIGEFIQTRRLIKDVYPSGIVSVVADSFDFWQFVSEFLPNLKTDIMSRDGKTVLRPDSGDPVQIICGEEIAVISLDDAATLEEFTKWAGENIAYEVSGRTPHGEQGEESASKLFRWNGNVYDVELEIEWDRYDKRFYYLGGSRIKSCEKVVLSSEEKGLIECLWDTFGGTVNKKGFKSLDSHIGAIYGDSITLERQHQILQRLADKGFAADNVVLGIGSYTYQYVTRDTFGFAMKATYGEIYWVGKPIFKDPKTDSGMKKSAKGLLCVSEVNGEFVMADNVSREEERDSALETVFMDGVLLRDQTLGEIRNILKGS